mgnify:CR=1 FL=1
MKIEEFNTKLIENIFLGSNTNSPFDSTLFLEQSREEINEISRIGDFDIIHIELPEEHVLCDGYAIDENSEAGAAQTDYKTMYAKYAYGPVTVGYTTSDEDSATAADNDEFTAYAISYAVSDDITVSYGESTYDFATVATHQENSALAVSYTMGSMTLSGVAAEVENIGGNTTAINDVKGYELNLSFAF